MLRALERLHVGTDWPLVEMFFAREAFGDLDDYVLAVSKTHGEQTARAILVAVSVARQRTGQVSAALTEAMPEPDFLTLVEGGIAQAFEYTSSVPTVTSQFENICARRGLPYELDLNRRFVWTGDAVIQEHALRPAFAALDDPRLAGGPAREFGDAVALLRERTPGACKRAVAEASNAVESALKVLLREHSVSPLDRHSLDALLGAAKAAQLLPSGVDGKVPVEQILAGPGRFGNRRGRHGSGEAPHNVGPDEAEAVVSAAAVAITFVARRLPA